MRRSLAAGLTAAAALLAVAFAPGPAQGQTDQQAVASAIATVTELEFNFYNPGARSLAMGGAFLGRADDASAAYANPAGLVELTQPEVSAEFRDWTYTAKIGLPSVEDGSIEPAGTSDLETAGLLYASYVYPRDRWTVAVYRFSLAGYDFGGGDEGSIATDLVTYGLAGAWRFDNGLSLGAVLVRNEAAIEAVAPCTGDPCEGLVISRADDTTIVGNVGFLWRLGDRWSFGGVYREGPEFGLRSSDDSGEVFGETRAFKVPDVMGLGVGLRPNSRTVINLDVMRVLYSQGPEAAGLERVTRPDGRPVGGLDLADVNEIRLGVEYSFWNLRGAPAIRFGAWWDPAHKIRFVAAPGLSTVPGPGGVSEAEVGAALERRFDGGQDRLHVTGGFGFVIGRRFQLDAGIDISDETESISVSTLVRF